MSQRQNAILRLTINVDFNEPGEVALIRAMLRRLNVLSAKSRPRSAFAEILKDGKLRDQLEVGRDREHKRRGIVVRLPGSTPEPTKSNVIALPNLSDPSKEVTVKRYEPPKPKFTYISLKEMRFEPPTDLVEIDGPAVRGVG
jgi:hypothetical protein